MVKIHLKIVLKKKKVYEKTTYMVSFKNYVKWFDKPNLKKLINYIEINQQST